MSGPQLPWAATGPFLQPQPILAAVSTHNLTMETLRLGSLKWNLLVVTQLSVTELVGKLLRSHDARSR